MNQELFGESRLQEALNIDPEETVESRCKNLKREIDRFVGDAEQFDDITMLGLMYKGGKNWKRESRADEEDGTVSEA
jgi:sigma-B regulation protein RsbU (phosphoserine phosphatase)